MVERFSVFLLAPHKIIRHYAPSMSSDFDNLQPNVILEAIESAGFITTGEYAQLNSYENRVFDVRLEATARALAPLDRLIAKFYRPRRWTADAVRDEHQFLEDLNREGIPAVAPLVLSGGSTTLEHEGYLLALFPRVSGRMPDEFLPGQLKQVGRTLARIHNVGSRARARHRPELTAETYGWPALARLESFVYPELWREYRNTCEDILAFVEDELDPASFIRIHGDCHKGNLIQTGGSEFSFVDFDDFCNGPVVQDFWMLLSGSLGDDDAGSEQDEICEGYEELREIPDQWHLFEPLRGLRIIHYGGWIAQRWNDPFFKRIFPTFTSYNYWADELHRLQKIADELGS